MADRLRILSACGCWWLATLAYAAELPQGFPAGGEAFRGKFAGADANWSLRFSEGATPRTIAAADLAAWGDFVEPGQGVSIVLAGGGLIVSDDARIDNERLLGHSNVFGKLSLPLEIVAAVILRPPLERTAADRLLARATSATGRDDHLLLDNGDELAGTISAMDENRVVLDTEKDPVEVKTARLTAVVFDPTLINRPRPSGLRAMVCFSDGSRVTAIEMASAAASTELKLAGGVQLKAPTESIVGLLVLGGRAAYLSDLKPSSYKHIPYLQLSWPYQTDRSVLGSPLRAAGRLYLKGLGMHSPARITYELDQSYRRFESEVAVDAEAGRRGSVVFRVFTDDGSGKLKERAATSVVRGGDAPQTVSVDLEGVKRITLLVDLAERGDELDHADWLNARLIK